MQAKSCSQCGCVWSEYADDRVAANAQSHSDKLVRKVVCACWSSASLLENRTPQWWLWPTWAPAQSSSYGTRSSKKAHTGEGSQRRANNGKLKCHSLREKNAFGDPIRRLQETTASSERVTWSLPQGLMWEVTTACSIPPAVRPWATPGSRTVTLGRSASSLLRVHNDSILPWHGVDLTSCLRGYHNDHLIPEFDRRNNAEKLILFTFRNLESWFWGIVCHRTLSRR